HTDQACAPLGRRGRGLVVEGIDARIRRHAGQSTPLWILGRDERLFAGVARRALNTVVIETVGPHGRDALVAHDTHAYVGRGDAHVLVDLAVGESRQAEVPRQHQHLDLVTLRG